MIKLKRHRKISILKKNRRGKGRNYEKPLILIKLGNSLNIVIN